MFDGPQVTYTADTAIVWLSAGSAFKSQAPLIQLAALIDWNEIDKTFSGHFVSDRGRPALPPRLVAGLLYLQHTFDCSDELMVNTWVENPYWQYFVAPAKPLKPA